MGGLHGWSTIGYAVAVCRSHVCEGGHIQTAEHRRQSAVAFRYETGSLKFVLSVSAIGTTDQSANDVLPLRDVRPYVGTAEHSLSVLLWNGLVQQQQEQLPFNGSPTARSRDA